MPIQNNIHKILKNLYFLQAQYIQVAKKVMTNKIAARSKIVPFK